MGPASTYRHDCDFESLNEYSWSLMCADYCLEIVALCVVESFLKDAVTSLNIGRVNCDSMVAHTT